jgi:hypothetical protein
MNNSFYAINEKVPAGGILPIPGRPRLNFLYGAVGLAILCSVIWVLFAFPVPPLQDYDDWTYQGYLLHRLLTFAPAPAIIKPWPVPNSISEVGLALLGFVFSPIGAARALIVFYLLAVCVVMALASRDCERRIDGARFVLLICIGVVHAPFWTGEINYQVGLLLFMLYVVLSSGRHDPGPFFSSAYSVLLFFCHGLCLGMFLVYEGWRWLRTGRILQLCFALTPVILMAVWYKLADPRTELATLDTRPQLHGITNTVGYFVYQVAKSGPYHNFIFGGMGDYERAPMLYWAGAVTNLVFAVSMGVLFLTWVRSSWRELSCRNELLTALTFICLAITDPSGYIGIANTGERLISPALMLAVISSRGRTVAEYIGASLAALSAIVFVCFVLVGSQVPDAGAIPANDIVSDPTKRFHILFWHKSFAFALQAEAAAQAWARGIVPTQPIAFETSLLMRPHESATQSDQGQDGVVAASSDTFLSSLGVVTHGDQGYDAKAYVRPLQYLGVRNIREGERNLSGSIMLHQQTGIRVDLAGPDVKGMISAARILASSGALLSLEGPNEPGNFPVEYEGQRGGKTDSWLPVARLQRDLYKAVKDDPVLKLYPVFHVSEGGAEADNVGIQFLTIPKGAGTLMPDGTRFADYANPHNYVTGNCHRYVNNQAWQAADPTLNSCWDGLFVEYGRTWKRGYMGYTEAQLQSLPRVSTETGWDSVSDPGGEDVQGKVLVNTYLAQFARGWRYTFIYELGDGEGGSGNQGLFHKDWTTKLAATYIHNLTSILADESLLFHPGSLTYSIKDRSETVHDLLLQKSNGIFELVVWGEQVDGKNNIVLRFATVRPMVEVYDVTLGVAPIQTLYNVTDVPLSVSDHALIIKTR